MLNIYWKDWCWSSNTLATWCEELTHYIRKDPDAGKDWGQKEKGTTKDEMVGWHHWLNGHEFEQALGDGEGQRSLACCSPWGRRVGQDWTMLHWGKIRTLPQDCTLISWLILSCLCTSSYLSAATVWICPLEIREGHENWSLFPMREMGVMERLSCPATPQGPARFHLE